jgi:hypothetical protein
MDPNGDKWQAKSSINDELQQVTHKPETRESSLFLYPKPELPCQIQSSKALSVIRNPYPVTPHVSLRWWIDSRRPSPSSSGTSVKPMPSGPHLLHIRFASLHPHTLHLTLDTLHPALYAGNFDLLLT